MVNRTHAGVVTITAGIQNQEKAQQALTETMAPRKERKETPKDPKQIK
jgi:hypothetical protein